MKEYKCACGKTFTPRNRPRSSNPACSRACGRLQKLKPRIETPCACGCGRMVKNIIGSRGRPQVYFSKDCVKKGAGRSCWPKDNVRYAWEKKHCYPDSVFCARYSADDCCGSAAIHEKDGSCRVEPTRKNNDGIMASPHGAFVVRLHGAPFR